MAKTAKKTTARKSSSKASAAAARTNITDDFTIKVVNKKNPFTGPVQVKHANAVFAAKTVGEAKKKGADSWTVRKLVELKNIVVSKPPVAKSA